MTQLGLLFFALLLTTLQPLHAEKIDNRNFAIDTYYPTPNEIRLAEQRARKYWEKHARQIWIQPSLSGSPGIPKYFRMRSKVSGLNSSTLRRLSSFFSHGLDKQTYSNLELRGIMIFDIRSSHFVSNRGFISVDTPPLGRLARFDVYIARYIGFGNWG